LGGYFCDNFFTRQVTGVIEIIIISIKLGDEKYFLYYPIFLLSLPLGLGALAVAGSGPSIPAHLFSAIIGYACTKTGA